MEFIVAGQKTGLFGRPGNGYWLPVFVVRRLEANPALCLSFRGVNWTLLIDSLDLSSR
jgi:hypothetical protein